ncbi:Mitochondrial import inner membrane translocase subunit tim22 [Boothiomyces macroporosus]|uniref:Mitochondrial import inner membrane translocase subunit TIM22 n=1 Tax=Boothiomyces macroporosus TaxID=261099 RepID=A0AAD5Y7P0_9FUNG|nr:Mitochondrial import inner membrane translocase subunit tim22 [Boothiomyces macroporosus]
MSQDQEEMMQLKAMKFAQQELMNSCPAKTLIGAAMGFAMGGLFGLFMSSADNALDDKFLRLSVREQTAITFKEMGAKAMSSAKSFGVLTAIFVSSECAIETIRGKDDQYNQLLSGCFTGAFLSRTGKSLLILAGVQAMGIGCVGFAAFSAAIETYMHRTRHN